MTVSGPKLAELAAKATAEGLSVAAYVLQRVGAQSVDVSVRSSDVPGVLIHVGHARQRVGVSGGL
jgi:hypothetical protein